MIADLNNVPRIFRELNKDIFSRKLSCPSFEIIHSNNTFGEFRYRRDGKKVTRPTIKVTDSYDFTEDDMKDIICHEMIHYLLAVEGKDMKCTHGDHFKLMMDSSNSTHGLHLSMTKHKKEFKKL